MRRQSARLAAARQASSSRASQGSPDTPSDSDSALASASALLAPTRPSKRRKTATSSSNSQVEVYRRLLRSVGGDKQPRPEAHAPSIPPARRHTLAYHAPLLLDAQLGPAGRDALLAWFESVSDRRAMPWRKPWLDPADFIDDDNKDGGNGGALRAALEKRAYEVWISEIMLQQTRVAVVVDYWNRWMRQWPRIQDLAAASPDDVLAAWRGLGYYSRATRIHEAARLVVADDSLVGLLPSSPHELAGRIPGVGRYTAGAIAAIVFGCPAPMVDGNVLRVLSRQLGIRADVKSDKGVIDMIWAAAEELVETVARDGHHRGDKTKTANADADAQDKRSDRPGRWGQAFMELGSTVCTPRPDCAQCPITSTCRAYHEGLAIRQGARAPSPDNLQDVEDMCQVCEPLEDEIDDFKPAAAKAGKRQAAPLAFFPTSCAVRPTKQPASKKRKSTCKPDAEEKAEEEIMIASYASKFPVKATKKVVREQETLVCAVVRGDGRYLLHKRPPRGLLAGLWEFPSVILVDQDGGAVVEPMSGSQRTSKAKAHVARLLGNDDDDKAEHVAELGSVPWLFSHIRLTMHVHLFRMCGCRDVGVGGAAEGYWSDCVEAASMGTGMRKCWELVRQAV